MLSPRTDPEMEKFEREHLGSRLPLELSRRTGWRQEAGCIIM